MNTFTDQGSTAIDIKAVIEALLRHVGMKAPSFAKSIGVKYQRVFDLINGRTKTLSPAMINAICNKYPEVNKNYLYTGEGELFIEAHKSYEQATTLDVMDMSRQVLAMMQKLSEREQNIAKREMELNERERKLNELERCLTRQKTDLEFEMSEISEDSKKSVTA